VVYYSVLQLTAMECTLTLVRLLLVVCCIALRNFAVQCSVVQVDAVCCSMLQCDAVLIKVKAGCSRCVSATVCWSVLVFSMFRNALRCIYEG